MPRYDFECNECHYIFEAITPVSIMVLPCNSEECRKKVYQPYAVRKLCAPASIHIH